MAKPNKAKTKAKVQKTAPKSKPESKPKAAKTAKPQKAKTPAPKHVAKPAAKPAARPASKTAKPAAHKPASKQNGAANLGQTTFQATIKSNVAVKMNPFLKKQRDRLLQLRDGMLDSMMGVAKDNLRSRAEGSEASAFGMHQADAGSDAYDRDFALSLLSQEQDALYEIDEALKRIDLGTYGVCEMSGKAIPHARLEAIPFARFTVECQSQLEKQNKLSRSRVPVTSLFGLTDDEGGDSEEEEAPAETKE
jgi:RNA polymerase-binding transcription factor DksA